MQAIRGMRDLLPADTAIWCQVERCITQLFNQYGYREIRPPIVEKTGLFQRTLGEITDIVEKEMYVFADRSGDSVALRPEGTASCVRAVLQNGLLHQGVQRLWYGGPMFRYERPQKGRYRQFHQMGVEVLGLSEPDIDVELIAMITQLWHRLAIDDLELQINSLGGEQTTKAYRTDLVAYLQGYEQDLDDDHKRRLHNNPLRLLDSKDKKIKAILHDAPSLRNYLDAESEQHFQTVLGYLDALGIAYRINDRLIRGLDYYSGTVFEWVSDSLGAQGAVCAGGRYNHLVKQLGGEETAAIGLAIGMDRLLEIASKTITPAAGPDVYLIGLGELVQVPVMILAQHLRAELPDLTLIRHCGGGSLKSQLKKADRSGAKLALIVGEEESARSVVSVKFLREQTKQNELAQADLTAWLTQYLNQ